MRSIEKLAPIIVALVALIAAWIAGGGAVWMLVREARAAAAAHAPEYVASIKT